MSKTIKTSESSHHETTPFGTLVGVILMNEHIAEAIDSATGGGSKTDYHLEVDGKTTTYSSRESRDEAARKSV